jgi:beta-glucanase (GH16 family)
MQRMTLSLILWSLLLAGCAHRAAVRPTTAAPTGKLVWADEFDSGATPDSAKWVMETGGGGWGNNELQSYTGRPENVSIRGGMLVIRAVAEPYTGTDGIARNYTSARLKTAGKFAQKYGRFEARIKIPHGQGIWPAFWMLGENIATAKWPHCGEIDIMENIGREPAVVHGTLHGPGYSGDKAIGAAYSLPTGRFADDFHVYAVEWEENQIRWYVDGKLYQARTPQDLPKDARWAFDQPFFLLLNLAVGGNWPGSPDASTSFPQEMLVDYVRVYAPRR